MKRTEDEERAIAALRAIKENLTERGHDVKFTIFIRDKLTQEVEEIVI